MLSEELGHIHKKLWAGEHAGYSPPIEVGIGFELWAGIRRKFLASPPNLHDEGGFEPIADVTPYGLHVSDSCSSELRAAAYRRFGSMYLGCIH
jgi:hypothetical protein